MKDLMPWTECKNKFLRKVSVDQEKIQSIVETAIARNRFIESITVSKKNISFVFEGYYEVIKELLVALMLKKGMRVRNHQCLFTFFSREYGYDAEVNIIKQMSFLRNRLDYYGEMIEYPYFKENYKNFKEIIRLLLKLVKK